ncbi:MAG: hypothetical protein AAGG68_15310 [Bacteroidota bacterium]
MKEAKKVFTRKMSIKSMMENESEHSEQIYYPIAGAFIQYLRSEKGDDLLKKILAEQTWENLLALYGEETIFKFEKMMK